VKNDEMTLSKSREKPHRTREVSMPFLERVSLVVKVCLVRRSTLCVRCVAVNKPPESKIEW
jgi:hypothetical protein